MKRVLTITFLNYFVSGGLSLTIPLLLLNRNVSLAEIGIIISVLPLVFLLARLVVAAFADQLGWAPIYILLNWPGTVFSTMIYFFANSTFAFFSGKILEAVKESSYWAVNRTAIFSLSPEQKGREATRNSAVISLSSAVGCAVSGLGIAYMGFSMTLGILMLASAVIGFPAALIWRTEKSDSRLDIRRAIALLDPRGRGRTFWFVSFIMLFYSLAMFPLLALILPVFMTEQLGYDYGSIGLVFMLANVFSALATFGTLKKPLGTRRVAVQSLIALSATFLFAYSGVFFPLLFFMLAIAYGIGAGFFEFIIARAIKDRVTVSVDIGLLHAPMRLAEFASALCAGFIAQSLGYMPVFAASGVFFMVFSVLSFYALKRLH